jgi:hypothetical protein
LSRSHTDEQGLGVQPSTTTGGSTCCTAKPYHSRVDSPVLYKHFHWKFSGGTHQRLSPLKQPLFSAVSSRTKEVAEGSDQLLLHTVTASIEEHQHQGALSTSSPQWQLHRRVAMAGPGLLVPKTTSNLSHRRPSCCPGQRLRTTQQQRLACCCVDPTVSLALHMRTCCVLSGDTVLTFRCYWILALAGLAMCVIQRRRWQTKQQEGRSLPRCAEDARNLEGALLHVQPRCCVQAYLL